ncbi:unnamed protein product [Staurois parvus]|uniref:Uncharacterized protein n=1 Tax=Staurois parvus TaxID=386267 RepID=A0ABN9C1G7_9NEOB|nr:unnamed protein product [Staurois parvus]
METAAMGGRTGTHDTLWTWQQHEESHWQITGLAAAMGGPLICQHPMTQNGTHQQCEET